MMRPTRRSRLRQQLYVAVSRARERAVLRPTRGNRAA